jgi:hypothetical protein
VSATRQVNIKVPAELADLLDAVVTDSPFIGGRSSLVRHGIDLALADVIERGVLNDKALSDRVKRYLEKNIAANATNGR